MRRVIALLAWTALVLTPLVSSAQFGGRGSIQGRCWTPPILPSLARRSRRRTSRPASHTAQTTTAGVYALTPLPPGEYRVTVTLDGFQTVRAKASSSMRWESWD